MLPHARSLPCDLNANQDVCLAKNTAACQTSGGPTTPVTQPCLAHVAKVTQTPRKSDNKGRTDRRYINVSSPTWVVNKLNPLHIDNEDVITPKLRSAPHRHTSAPQFANPTQSRRTCIHTLHLHTTPSHNSHSHALKKKKKKKGFEWNPELKVSWPIVKRNKRVCWNIWKQTDWISLIPRTWRHSPHFTLTGCLFLNLCSTCVPVKKIWKNKKQLNTCIHPDCGFPQVVLLWSTFQARETAGYPMSTSVSS